MAHSWTLRRIADLLAECKRVLMEQPARPSAEICRDLNEACMVLHRYAADFEQVLVEGVERPRPQPDGPVSGRTP